MKHRSPRLIAPFAFAIASALGSGCAAPADAGPTTTGSEEIVSVPQTDVERQAIGNTWLYAHASWIASMHKAATGESLSASPSYWAYWHWFDQIAGGTGTTIATGGNWLTASGIVRKYGLIPDAVFSPLATEADVSARQASALAAINLSLTTGALKGLNARRDRALVRKELDRAWALPLELSATLDRVFGPTVTRSLSSATSPADVAGSPVVRAEDLATAYTLGPGAPAQPRTLAQAMSDWREAYYPATDRRAFQGRIQRALMDAQPVIVTWFVDFAALETRDTSALRGSFNLTTLNQLGPGDQGGQMTVLEDYQAVLADGRLVAAGTPPTATGQTLDSALLASTQLEFLRVKNAWGSARPARAFAAGMPAYADLYFDYLDGPVKKCVQRGGVTDTTSCPTTTTPLQSVVLPPGY